MTSRTDMATAKFEEGYNCAQAVLYAFREELQLDGDEALKLACGFGAGMGRKEEVCGAISGAILALGRKFGRGSNDGIEATELTYAKTRELMDAFAGQHGTVICRTLLGGCELTTPEGRERFKQQNLRSTVCVPCVQSAVRILEELL